MHNQHTVINFVTYLVGGIEYEVTGDLKGNENESMEQRKYSENLEIFENSIDKAPTDIEV